MINEKQKWIGGKTHLVQIGDIPDRGPDTDKIIELVMSLERPAKNTIFGQKTGFLAKNRSIKVLEPKKA